MSGQPLRARGGGGDGDVVVANALHKFGLEEKRKKKTYLVVANCVVANALHKFGLEEKRKEKKKLILLLPIEAGGLCARKECAAGEGVPVCARGCCPR